MIIPTYVLVENLYLAMVPTYCQKQKSFLYKLFVQNCEAQVSPNRSFHMLRPKKSAQKCGGKGDGFRSWSFHHFSEPFGNFGGGGVPGSYMVIFVANSPVEVGS